MHLLPLLPLTYNVRHRLMNANALTISFINKVTSVQHFIVLSCNVASTVTLALKINSIDVGSL